MSTTVVYLMLLSAALGAWALVLFVRPGGREREVNFESPALSRYGRDQREFRDLLETGLRQLELLQDRNARELSERVSASLGALDGTRDHRSDALVREVSHSLGTPIAGIVAEIGALRPGAKSEAMVERFDRIEAAAELCQAFLLSYRHLERVDMSTGFLQGEPLQTLLEKAGRLYVSQTGNHIELDVDVPQELPGYSNYQVLAALLPLLENAVEAGAPVGVSHGQTADCEVLSVRNASEARPSADLLIDGVSTKEAHDGLGLGISQRLVQSIGGSLDWSHQDSEVVFVVTLPRRVA